jgi:stage V sporulation protein G
MVITEIKVYPVKDSGRLKAYATMVFDSCFIIRDLKVIEGDKGLFVSMPSRRRKDGFRDIVHPLNSGTRTEIENRIITEYERTASEAVSAEEALEYSDSSYDRD